MPYGCKWNAIWLALYSDLQTSMTGQTSKGKRQNVFHMFSTAFGALIFILEMFRLEPAIFVGRVYAAASFQMAAVGVFVGEFAQNRQYCADEYHLDFLQGQSCLNEWSLGTANRMGTLENADPLTGGFNHDSRDEDEEKTADEGVEIVIED